MFILRFIFAVDMPSTTKENYLKALYTLHQRDEQISLTDLGNQLDVSKPTVNDMVKKLQAKGWIVYEKYKPVTLTLEGKKAAALIIRKHRLSEMFLAKVMGFGWEEVHEVAEELEHIKSQKLFDRMDELLGFPNEDPHGSPIPDKNGNLTKHNYVLLSSIGAKGKVILRALKVSSVDFLLFLNKKGLELGTEIKVHQVEDFDKSLTISYLDEKEVTLTHHVAQRLLVEKV